MFIFSTPCPIRTRHSSQMTQHNASNPGVMVGKKMATKGGDTKSGLVGVGFGHVDGNMSL